jgi:hypothetical protein
MFKPATIFAPSLNSLFVTGFIMLFIFYLIFINFNQLIRLDYYRKIQILCLISIAFGIHGLIHLGMENVYGFNPYKWIYNI